VQTCDLIIYLLKKNVKMIKLEFEYEGFTSYGNRNKIAHFVYRVIKKKNYNLGFQGPIVPRRIKMLHHPKSILSLKNIKVCFYICYRFVTDV